MHKHIHIYTALTALQVNCYEVKKPDPCDMFNEEYKDNHKNIAWKPLPMLPKWKWISSGRDIETELKMNRFCLVYEEWKNILVRGNSLQKGCGMRKGKTCSRTGRVFGMEGWREKDSRFGRQGPIKPKKFNLAWKEEVSLKDIKQ